MPAAAVIPAPIAYIKVVAVKKLVVEPWGGSGVWSAARSVLALPPPTLLAPRRCSSLSGRFGRWGDSAAVTAARRRRCGVRRAARRGLAAGLHTAGAAGGPVHLL